MMVVRGGGPHNSSGMARDMGEVVGAHTWCGGGGGGGGGGGLTTVLWKLA